MGHSSETVVIWTAASGSRVFKVLPSSAKTETHFPELGRNRYTGRLPIIPIVILRGGSFRDVPLSMHSGRGKCQGRKRQVVGVVRARISLPVSSGMLAYSITMPLTNQMAKNKQKTDSQISVPKDRLLSNHLMVP